MSPDVFALGYTNSNHLYKIVMNHKKIITTTRQITGATTQNLVNVIFNNTTSNITTDAPEVDSNDNDDSPIFLIPAGSMIAMILLYVLFKWCVQKIMAICKRSNSSSSTNPNSGETTPLLQHKYPVDGQPPSYAELSPSYPSPPAYLELNMGTG